MYIRQQQEISSPRSAKRKHGQSEPVTAEERHPKREKDEKKCAIGASEISKKQQLPQRTISTTDLRLTRDRSFSVSQKVKGVYRSLSQRTRQRLQRHKPTPSRQYHGEPESYRGEFQLWYRSVSEDERMNVPKIEQQRREVCSLCCFSRIFFFCYVLLNAVIHSIGYFSVWLK